VVLSFLDYGVPKVFSPSSHDALIESSELPNEFPKFPTAKIENNITNNYSTLIFEQQYEEHHNIFVKRLF